VSELYKTYYSHPDVTYNDWRHRFLEQAALLWLRTDTHANIENLVTVIPMPAISALRDALSDMMSYVIDKKLELERLKQ